MGLKPGRRNFFVAVFTPMRRLVQASYLLLLSLVLLVPFNGALLTHSKMMLPKRQQPRSSIWTRPKPILLLIIAGVMSCGLFDVSRSYATEQPSLLSESGSRLSKYLAGHNTSPTVSLILGRTACEDPSWTSHFKRWRTLTYIVDDPLTPYSVPENKGHEAMVYLTYIITHYHNLSDINIFHHAGRYQWHTDDPLHDSLRVLFRLRLPYVLQQGYVNLRCAWTLGCPMQVRPHAFDHEKPLPEDAIEQEYLYKSVFEAVLPGEHVPEEVGVACCGQFAVTREWIHARPLSTYILARRWLLETEVESDMIGRVMEHVWHIMFGAEAVHCPNAEECYCRTFGVCNLDCSGEEGLCKERWDGGQDFWNFTLTLPAGWPERGWEGKMRDIDRLRKLQEFDLGAR